MGRPNFYVDGQELFRPTWAVWKKIIFRLLEAYKSANMTDIHKIPFGYCLDINS